MSVRVEFRWGEDLLAAVDLARGDVPRAVWVRRAVERALSDAEEPFSGKQAGLGSVSSSEGVRPAAPAEQPLSRADAFRRVTQR